MNLASVLNISAPLGAPVQQAAMPESGFDFDALMETVASPLAASALPKSEAAVAPLSLANAAPVAPDIGDTRKLELPQVVAGTATALKAAVITPEVQNEPALDAPPAVKDLAWRASSKTPKEGLADAEKVRTAQTRKETAAAKSDKTQHQVPVDISKIAVAPNTTASDSDDDEEKSADLEITLSLEDAAPDTTLKSQPVPAQQLAAPNSQPVETSSKPEVLVDSASIHARTDKAKDVSPSPAPELPVKVAQAEQSVSVFTMPTPSVVSTTAMTAPIFATPDNFNAHQLDLAHDSQWIDQLTRDIVAVAGQDGKLRFGLSPSNLGQLEVSVETRQDGVNIQMQASTEAAARIFAAEQPKLVEELRQSGVRVMNSDLLGGQQMQGQRDQSRAQNAAWQSPSSLTSNITPNRTSTSNQNTSRNGRFA
jgi:flagellar hook-length control protein FliK